jgi:hypothetical protein
MTTLLATVTAGQNTSTTTYVVLCVIEFLIVMVFAGLWFVFPLVVWMKLNEQIKLLKQMAK